MDIRLTEAQRAACAAIAGAERTSMSQAAIKLIQLLGDRLAIIFGDTNEITSIIAHSLALSIKNGSGGPDWQDFHDAMTRRITSYLEELDYIAGKMSESFISLVALKNGGIARGIYPCPGCCPMGDIDVLVARGDFLRAHRILLENGYQPALKSLGDGSFAGAEKRGVAEYAKLLPDGQRLELELHWRPITGRWIRPEQEPDGKTLISRSIRIPATDVRLLAPEDNLLQVALHTARHTYIRAPGFRLHLDVERIVRYQKIDWDLFVERVVSLQVKTPVYFSLFLPHLFFDTPIPEAVLSRLKPSGWKASLVLRWLSNAGFFNPHERKFGRIGYIIFNALLYDDLKGLMHAIIPDASVLKDTYNFKNSLLLPFFYLKRLGNLAFKRLKT